LTVSGIEFQSGFGDDRMLIDRRWRKVVQQPYWNIFSTCGYLSRKLYKRGLVAVRLVYDISDVLTRFRLLVTRGLPWQRCIIYIYIYIVSLLHEVAIVSISKLGLISLCFQNSAVYAVQRVYLIACQWHVAFCGASSQLLVGCRRPRQSAGRGVECAVAADVTHPTQTCGVCSESMVQFVCVMEKSPNNQRPVFRLLWFEDLQPV